MSFPLNPQNGDKAVINNIKYIYSSATNTWRRDFNNVLDRLFLVGQNQATSTGTGDLVVYGGAGIGKNLQVGGNLTVYGSALFLGTITGVVSTSTTAINLQGGTQGSLVYQSGTSTTAFLPISSTGSILVSNGVTPVWTTTAAITAAYSITATNLLSGGTFQIPFQAAPSQTTFSPDFTYNNATLTISNTTASTGTTNGALVVSGGVGIGGDLFVGGNLQINGTRTFVNTVDLEVTDKNILLSKGSINAAASDGAGLTIAGPTTPPTLLYFASDDSWTFNKLLKSTTAQFTSNTIASSTITGALRVIGGVGIGGDLFATTINGPLTGTVGASVRNSGAFTTVNVTNAVVATSTNTGALQVVGGVGIGGALYVGNNATALTLQATASTNSVSTTTGAAVITGGVGIGRDLYVGGTIYGNSTNANYSNTATLANLATTATNIASGATNQIPFQTGIGLTGFSANLTFDGTAFRTNRVVATASNSSVLPAAYFGIDLQNTLINQSPAIRLGGSTSGIVLISSFGTLKVLQDGGSLTNTLMNVALSGVSIPILTASINTATGAFTVAGGAGIGGQLNVGSNITVGGDILPTTDVIYNLGSPTQKWKSVYVSSSTVYLDDNALSVTSNSITINGMIVGASNTVSYDSPTDASEISWSGQGTREFRIVTTDASAVAAFSALSTGKKFVATIVSGSTSTRTTFTVSTGAFNTLTNVYSVQTTTANNGARRFFNTIELPLPMPTTSTSPGIMGQVTYDGTYVYMCVAENTWRRWSAGTF